MVSSLGALCVLELGLLFPTSGGTYVYMYELGDIVAFLYAWLSVLISRPSSGTFKHQAYSAISKLLFQSLAL